MKMWSKDCLDEDLYPHTSICTRRTFLLPITLSSEDPREGYEGPKLHNIEHDVCSAQLNEGNIHSEIADTSVNRDVETQCVI